MKSRKIHPEFEEFLSDESKLQGDAEEIVFAEEELDIQNALKMARKRNCAITVQGARTGIVGGAVPVHGILLNLSRMNRILSVEEQQICVQPGVSLLQIQKEAASRELFFPPDPTEKSASVGGILANNASGSRSFHYGSVRPWVESARIVLPDGDLLVLARGDKIKADLSFSCSTLNGRKIEGKLPAIKRPKSKNATGYFVQPGMDLLDLFIGMEGTLGIFSEVTLRLLPLPPARQMLCAFLSEESQSLELLSFLRNGKPSLAPISIEFFDEYALDLLRVMKNQFPFIPHLPRSFHHAICCEFHGKEDEVEAAILNIAEYLKMRDVNEDSLWWATSEKEILRLENFRHAVPEAVNMRIAQYRKKYPTLTKLGTDFSVPDFALENLLATYRRDLLESGLEYLIFGHLGENHLHVNILPKTPEEYGLGKKLYLKWAEKVVAVGGSLSAEHGIGKLKASIFQQFISPETCSAMQMIHRLFNPESLLNPGNIFSDGR